MHYGAIDPGGSQPFSYTTSAAAPSIPRSCNLPRGREGRLHGRRPPARRRRLGRADRDYLLECFRPSTRIRGGRSEEFLQSLAAGAEDIKIQLSRMQSRRFNARFGGDTSQIEVTREKFEELTSELMERTATITRRTLQTAAERGVAGFDDVLLVGGSSRMPAVTAVLEGLGLKPRMHDPDLAVAEGGRRGSP